MGIIRLRSTALHVSFCAALAACNCSDQPAKSAPEGDGIERGDVGSQDAGPDAAVDSGQPDGGGTFTAKRLLVIEGASRFDMGTRSSARLTVHLVEGSDGSSTVPVGGADVRFAISGANPGAATLSALTVSTDSSGLARVDFLSGTRTALVKVVASADRAPAVNYLVNVTVRPATLAATVNYSGAMPVTGVEVSVFQPFDCARVDYAHLPFPALRQASAADALSPVRLERIDDGTPVTAVAVVRGNREVVLAGGCAPASGELLVLAPQTAVIIDTTDREESLAGVYQTAARLHLNEALPEPYGSVIGELSRALADTGGYLTDLLVDRMGMDPDDTFAMLLQTALPPVIDSALQNVLPPEVRDGIDVVGDVTGMMSDFEVGIQLNVKGATATDFSGHEQWQRLLFHWTRGCNPANACCGRTVVSPQEMNVTPVSSNVTGTVTFVGRAAQPGSPVVQSFRLDVPEHPMHLRYGAVLLYVVEHFVLPNLPGTLASNSLQDLLGKLVDCVGVGNAVYNAIGMDPGQAATICTDVVAAADRMLMEKLLALDTQNGTESSFRATERFFLTDKDLDLVTEIVEDGTMTGAVYSNGTRSTDFTGTFHGIRERPSCATDADCRQGLVCRPFPDVLDACSGGTWCDARAGAAADGASCTRDAGCASGACIGATGTSHPGACFTPCGRNSDCPTGKVCKADGARLVFDAGSSATSTADDLWAALPACAVP